MKLEQLAMCVNHIRTMKSAYVNDKDLKHRTCDGYNKHCENYRPYKPEYQIPIKKGIIAYEILKHEHR